MVGLVLLGLDERPSAVAEGDDGVVDANQICAFGQGYGFNLHGLHIMVNEETNYPVGSHAELILIAAM